jgi:hypothetical protein
MGWKSHCKKEKGKRNVGRKVGIWIYQRIF